MLKYSEVLETIGTYDLFLRSTGDICRKKIVNEDEDKYDIVTLDPDNTMMLWSLHRRIYLEEGYTLRSFFKMLVKS